PELLVREGLLEPADFEDSPAAGEGTVDYRRSSAFKERLLRRAFERLLEPGAESLRQELASFAQAAEHEGWLEDWSLFEACRRTFDGEPWWRWPEPLAERDEGALKAFAASHRREIEYHRFVQVLFHRQLRSLRSRAKARGIRLIGDLPIYLALDSADVWSHRRFFDLDASGQPREVAGVPPDLFSETGQLWGNPLYDWEALRDEGFSWWVERIRHELSRLDLLRLDHFRGFEAFWSVPAQSETAEAGSWQPGPGAPLFEALEAALGELPLIAENLGVITPEVEALRRRFRLPGMAVLQFAFSEEGTVPEHAPHAMARDTVVYTGTHDNPPIAAWWQDLSLKVRENVTAYCGATEDDASWALIRLAHTSVADLAVIPAQDLLALGREARMNTPGTPEGNWRWRLRPGDLTPDLAHRLAHLTRLTGRLPTGD
ncbi:MAG: 4-alpha-glucanotransferase, partial [Acidobacteria bacterium]|nr:4-alpha-glucanotransferase [Acidobacteriota bacterium]